MEIKDLITNLRNTDPFIKQIFLSGGCYKLYEFLSKTYSGTRCYINKEKTHVATYYEGKIYDITGERDIREFTLATENEIEECKTWSFHQRHFVGVKCWNCEEVVSPRS